MGRPHGGKKASDRQRVAIEMEVLCSRGLTTDHIVNQTSGIPSHIYIYIFQLIPHGLSPFLCLDHLLILPLIVMIQKKLTSEKIRVQNLIN